MLQLYIKNEAILTNHRKILDFAPKKCLSDFIKNNHNGLYVTSDLNSPSAMVLSDLTQMGMAGKSFDLILCFHVLEHITNDPAAFTELKRLLLPSGFGFLMVPIKGLITIEEPSISQEEKRNRFGQHDHVRAYGMDIVARMTEAGLQVEVLDMFNILGERNCTKYGLYGDDRFIFKFSRSQESTSFS